MTLTSIAQATLGRRLGPATVIPTVLLILLAAAVLAPLYVLIDASLTVPTGSDFGILDQWRGVLASPALHSAMKNTIELTLVHQSISLPIAIGFSWLLGRTDLPARRSLEFGFWIAFFLPALGVLQGWILLLSPQTGLLNKAAVALLHLNRGPFDIYSWWGIVFAHLATTAIAAKVMLMTPIFRTMDASFEEAARMAGDTTGKAIRRIVVPILTPAIAVTAILGIIYALESFEIELVLGGPSGIDVYSTLIYREVRMMVPDYASASTLGLIVIPLIAVLALLPQLITRGKDYTTLTGRARLQPIRLGRWRWPAFAVTLMAVSLLTIVPAALLALGSVMSLYGFFQVTPMLTVEHWQTVLADSTLLRSLINTFRLGLGAAAFTVVIGLVYAYVIARTRFWGRSLMDFLSWVPFTMPGILFSLAVLWLVLRVPFLRPLYGTTPLLILTIGIATLPLTTQIIKSNLLQIGPDIEHASWVLGQSRARTILRIVIPLAIHAIVVVGVSGFIGAVRGVGYFALLASTGNRPLALMQLEYMIDGRFEEASVIGLIEVALTIGATLLARAFGFRIGPKSE